MADQQHQSVLSIVLRDDVSPEAKAMGEALVRAATQAKQLDEVLAKSGTSQKFQDNLRRIGATLPQVEGATKALRALADAEGIAADKAGWTADQAKRFKNLELVATSSIRAQMRAEDAQAKARQEAVAQQVRQAAMAADAELRQAERAAKETERQKRSETEFVISEMRRRAQERARVAEEEVREARRVADAEMREAKRAADAAIREAEREAREIARAREQELAAARRDHERAIEAQRRMGFGHYVAQGIAAGVSAHGVMSGAEFAAEKGAELQNARISLNSAGFTPDMARRIESQALQLSTRFGNVGETALMELAKEARSVVTSPDDLLKIMPSLAAAKSTLDASGVAGASDGLTALVKGSESIGAAKDPDRLARLIEAYVKATQVMGATISPEKIYDFDKNSRLAGAQFSDRFLTTTAMSILQEMGGQSAGKAANQAVTELTSGLGNRTVAVKELMNLGLVDRHDVRFNRTGEVSGVRKGVLHPVAQDSLLASDPDLWFYNTLLPAMEKHGLTKEGDQIAAIRQIFSGSVAAQDMMGKFLVQRESYAAHAGNYDTAAGFHASADQLDSATVGLDAFNKALGNLLANATSPLMPLAGRSLIELSKSLDWVAGIAKDHPAVAGTVAVTATGAGLAGAGYLGMKALNGFGLGASATALDASAAALSAAAAELSGAAAVEGGKNVLSGGAAAEVAKDAAKGLTGAAAVAAGAAITAGAAVMAGTVWGLSKAVPPKQHGPIADALDPRVKDDLVNAPPHGMGRTNLPAAPDNSGVGQGTGRGFLHRTAFIEGGGDITGLSSAEAMIARGTQAGFEAAFRNLMATGTTNGAGVGSGLIQASFETDDGVEVGSGGARMSSGGRARNSLPSLRYGRDAGGHYRFTPGADGPIDHFTAAGRTFASKSPELMRRMMKDFQLGPDQAAVIMGNLGHESQGFTAFHEKGLPYEKGGIGWAQWTGSRRREYEAWTQADHLDPKSDEANYGFLKHELMGNPRYRRALDKLRASKGTEKDLEDFEQVFEGAGVKGYGSRWAYDRKALRALHDDPTLAKREEQGPRLPERRRNASPVQGEITAMSGVGIIDHENLDGALHKVRQIRHEMASLHQPSVSVSVVHGKRGSNSTQLASRAEVGRHVRGVPSIDGFAYS